MRTLIRSLAFVYEWVAIAVAAFAYRAALEGIGFGLGSTPREVGDVQNIFSLPLGFINPYFVIEPTTPPAHAFGAIFLNAFFWTIPVFAAWRFVRFRLWRGKHVTLDLSEPRRTEDVDEDLLP